MMRTASRSFVSMLQRISSVSAPNLALCSTEEGDMYHMFPGENPELPPMHWLFPWILPMYKVSLCITCIEATSKSACIYRVSGWLYVILLARLHVCPIRGKIRKNMWHILHCNRALWHTAQCVCPRILVYFAPFMFRSLLFLKWSYCFFDVVQSWTLQKSNWGKK